MNSILNKLKNIRSEVSSLQKIEKIGRITAIKGLMLECEGISGYLSIGSKVSIFPQNIICEVVAFENNRAILMPFSDISGVGIGVAVKLFADENIIYPDESWLGRVINAFGDPIDDLGPTKKGGKSYPLKGVPPNPQKRNRVEKKIDLGNS